MIVKSVGTLRALCRTIFAMRAVAIDACTASLEAVQAHIEQLARACPGHVGVTCHQIADWLLELRNLRTIGALDSSVVCSDDFTCMWNEQISFMESLVTHRGFPRFPVSLESRDGQRLIKEIANDAVGELYEAIQHLKNAKRHRATLSPEFDREAFLEELVDAFKFMLEVAILAGTSKDEFIASFRRKSAINKKRIDQGY